MSDAAAERRVIDEVTKGLVINGQVRDAAEGKTFPVEDPSTGEILCEVADASPDDGMAALDAANKAQPDWAATAPRERGEIRNPANEAPVDAASVPFPPGTTVLMFGTAEPADRTPGDSRPLTFALFGLDIDVLANPRATP